jgi:hypothetical protein
VNNIRRVIESGHEEYDIRLIALVTHDKSRDYVHNDVIIRRLVLQASLMLKFLGKGKGVESWVGVLASLKDTSDF